jgi:aldose 1-epimerase
MHVFWGFFGPIMKRLQAVATHVASPMAAAAAAGGGFEIVDDSFDGTPVKQLRNKRTGEFVEILMAGKGGAVGGLSLLSTVSGELRTVQPHRTAQAGTVMAPFANRVKNGSYTFQGTTYSLNDGSSHAIHGLLPTTLPCTASTTLADSASLTLSHSFDGSDPGYPFAVTVDFCYTLDAGGLTIEVSARNVAEDGRAAPFMCGWHPWFCVGDVADAVVHLDPRSSWNVCDHLGSIPGTHADGYEDVVPNGTSTPFTRFDGEPLGDNFWDDGMKSVSPAAKVGTLETKIIDSASGDAAVLWQDAQHRFIQVYTGQAAAGVVAVEPMSGSTDCFNNADGLIVLQAGEEWGGSFGVKMAAA